MDAVDALVHDALVTTAIVALPVLIAAALVGAIVAIAQAATQIQEQTLTLLPKAIAVGLMVAVFGKNRDASARLAVPPCNDVDRRTDRSVVTSLLVFARCVGFVFRAPGFSHPSVPAPLRAGFAMLLAMVIIRAGIARAAPVDGAAAILALTLEFSIGSALGMGSALLYDAAYAGGRAVDDYVGVKAIAPSVALVAPSGFGRVWSLAFTGAFFLSGAYRIVLMDFARSFERLSPNATVHASGWAAFAASFLASFYGVALEIAAPAIGVAFIVQIAVGALARVVPRFGSVTLAFPLAFAAALIVTAIAVPPIAGHLRAPIWPNLAP